MNPASFTKWPEGTFGSDKTNIRVGILGKDPFGKSLKKAFKDRKINGRELVIRRSNSIADLKGVQILFVTSKEVPRLPDIIDYFKGKKHVLIIGDSPGFASRGGGINFVRQGTSVGFEINPDALKRVSLSMHPTVLRLAKIVRDGK